MGNCFSSYNCPHDKNYIYGIKPASDMPPPIKNNLEDTLPYYLRRNSTRNSFVPSTPIFTLGPIQSIDEEEATKETDKEKPKEKKPKEKKPTEKEPKEKESKEADSNIKKTKKKDNSKQSKSGGGHTKENMVDEELKVSVVAIETKQKSIADDGDRERGRVGMDVKHNNIGRNRKSGLPIVLNEKWKTGRRHAFEHHLCARGSPNCHEPDHNDPQTLPIDKEGTFHLDPSYFAPATATVDHNATKLKAPKSKAHKKKEDDTEEGEGEDVIVFEEVAAECEEEHLHRQAATSEYDQHNFLLPPMGTPLSLMGSRPIGSNEFLDSTGLPTTALHRELDGHQAGLYEHNALQLDEEEIRMREAEELQAAEEEEYRRCQEDDLEREAILAAGGLADGASYDSWGSGLSDESSWDEEDDDKEELAVGSENIVSSNQGSEDEGYIRRSSTSSDDFRQGPGGSDDSSSEEESDGEEEEGDADSNGCHENAVNFNGEAENGSEETEEFDDDMDGFEEAGVAGGFGDDEAHFEVLEEPEEQVEQEEVIEEVTDV